ncbi:hypothetical protein CVT25_010669 [Psilocybe cyanescens]|uniref:Uncharacterized protein n=1 Tax=Psilocybe cyanescens TaxID=93625 RepID=A0A409XT75_PSICY|nr:hypothetical protein CVT25_010669 [Psilocybe cyanescens]
MVYTRWSDLIVAVGGDWVGAVTACCRGDIERGAVRCSELVVGGGGGWDGSGTARCLRGGGKRDEEGGGAEDSSEGEERRGGDEGMMNEAQLITQARVRLLSFAPARVTTMPSENGDNCGAPSQLNLLYFLDVRRWAEYVRDFIVIILNTYISAQLLRVGMMGNPSTIFDLTIEPWFLEYGPMSYWCSLRMKTSILLNLLIVIQFNNFCRSIVVTTVICFKNVLRIVRGQGGKGAHGAKNPVPSVLTYRADDALLQSKINAMTAIELKKKYVESLHKLPPPVHSVPVREQVQKGQDKGKNNPRGPINPKNLSDEALILHLGQEARE